MRYATYPKYKESGVEWLGAVPEGWKAKKIKHICTIRYGLGEPPENDPEGIPFVRATDINRGKIDLGAVKRVNPGDIPCHRRPNLKKDEILIVRSGTYTGDSAIVTQEVEGCIAGYDMVVTVVFASPRFVSWVMLSKYMLESQIYIERLRAAQPHLNAEELGGFVVLVPSFEEQTAIADFLDRETGRIDTLTAKKRALIGLLKEKRTALISQTVTRGLPADAAREFGLEPHTRFKDSGIEWLGEVPEGWNLKRLSYIALLKSGESITSEQIAEGGDYPVFGGNGLRGFFSEYTHNGEFILIGRQGALCGNINYARGKFWASEHAVVLNPLVPFATSWLGELLRAMNLNQYSVSAAQPGLSVSMIGALKVSVPPAKEQTAIAAYLDRETAKLDTLIQKIEAAIDRLQEYRTALITAAVTGKIDVRNQASKKEAA